MHLGAAPTAVGQLEALSDSPADGSLRDGRYEGPKPDEGSREHEGRDEGDPQEEDPAARDHGLDNSTVGRHGEVHSYVVDLCRAEELLAVADIRTASVPPRDGRQRLARGSGSVEAPAPVLHGHRCDSCNETSFKGSRDALLHGESPRECRGKVRPHCHGACQGAHQLHGDH